MVITAQEKLALIEKFINICQKNNIWYAADLKTLLAICLNKNQFIVSNQFEVMMTYWSYERLKRLVPKLVIDSYTHKTKSLIAFFVVNPKHLITKKITPKFQCGIKIRIVLPTKIKKIKQFRNIMGIFYQKIRGQNKNIKNAFNFLHEFKHEGFFWLDQNYRKIRQNWSPVVDFSTKIRKIDNLEIQIVKNSEFLLNLWFGDDWKHQTLI